MSDRLPPDATIGRVALRVEDLDRQVAFYEDVLGLSTVIREDTSAVLGAADERLIVLSERADLRRDSQ